MTAEGERKNTKASRKHLLGCHCASESAAKHLRECGGGEVRRSVWTDSPTNIPS